MPDLRYSFKLGDILEYHDGILAHDGKCQVLAVGKSGMRVQFDDRADTTFIAFDDMQWMAHLTRCN